MSGFLDLKQINVPRSVVEAANDHLRTVGRSGFEAFSLWAGHREGELFVVQRNIVPEQTGHRTPSGVCVSVGPDELFRLNVWLYNNNMTLVAQLHSHPTEAYHSDTDDAFPIATTIGSLSIVIANYAQQSFALDRCAVYRLLPPQQWVGMTPTEVSNLVRIVENT
jgi:hypothetical protein